MNGIQNGGLLTIFTLNMNMICFASILSIVATLPLMLSICPKPAVFFVLKY